MANQNFDPYFEWLRIPPSEQPPNHYRLLNLARFEANSEQIDLAVARLVTRLQSLSEGPHVEHAQRLLNDTAKARLCLSDPIRKLQYDAQLKETLGFGRMLTDAPTTETANDRSEASSALEPPPPISSAPDADSANSDQPEFAFSDSSTVGNRNATKPPKTPKTATDKSNLGKNKRPSSTSKKLPAKRSAKKTNPNAMMWGTFFSLLLLIIVGGGSAYLAKQYFTGEDGRLSPNATTKFEGEAQEQSLAELAQSMGKSTTLTNDTTKQAKAPAPATEVITIKIPGEKTARKIQMGDRLAFTAPVLKIVKSQSGKTRYVYFSNDPKSMLIARLSEKNFPKSWSFEELQKLEGKKATFTGVVTYEPKARPLILELSTAKDLVVE